MSPKKQSHRKRRSHRRTNTGVDKTEFTRLIKAQCTSAPVQGISVSNFIYNYWSPRTDGGGLLPITNSTEFRMLALMYDRFRIHSVSVRYTPRANMLSMYDAVDGSLNNGSGMVYVAQLRAGQGPSHPSQMKRIKGCRVYSVLKPFTSTYKLKYPKGVWLDCKDPNQSNQQGIVESIGQQGGITIYGENFPEPAGSVTNNAFYDCEITYKLSFSVYNPLALSVDGTGVKIDTADALPNFDLSPVSAVDETTGGHLSGEVLVSG